MLIPLTRAATYPSHPGSKNPGFFLLESKRRITVALVNQIPVPEFHVLPFAMPRITEDPTRATCPSFEDPEWEFLRQSMVDAHQGDQAFTLEDAAQQMKDIWARENERKIAAWNDQLEQDQAVQDEQDRLAQEEEDARRIQRDKEVEEQRKEAERKRPKLGDFDASLPVERWIEPRPSSYAVQKLDNLEYLELDYFTQRACREATVDAHKSINQDTMAITQLGDSFAFRPMSALKPSKHIRNDEDLSWEEMLDAKNLMLHFMAKSGLWPVKHAEALATFFVNLELHPRKSQVNGKKALMLYQSRVRREWFDALKNGVGFNISLIQDDLLRSYAEEFNDAIRDRDNAIRDREIDQVRSPRGSSRGHYADYRPVSSLPRTKHRFFPCHLHPCHLHSPPFATPAIYTHAICHPCRVRHLPLATATRLSCCVPLLPFATCHHVCHLPFATCHLPPRVPHAICHSQPRVLPAIRTAAHNSSAGQMPMLRHVPHPGATERAHSPRRGQSPPGGAAAHVLHTRTTNHRLTAQTGSPGMGHGAPGGSSPSFFSPAQAHVGESALSVSGATNTISQNATNPSSGTAHPAPPGRTSRDEWSQQMASPSASTGRLHGDATPPAIPTGTGAQVVGGPITGLKAALEQRRCEPLTPYKPLAWAEGLSCHALQGRYPLLVQGLMEGFDLGIPQVRRTYTPPNHSSIRELHDVYSSITNSEFSAGRYIGPFTQHQLEAVLGPFQTSPLSLVPKTSKPGKFRAVHNFSHPHNPLPNTSSINSHIDANLFPCTWGTFSTVALLFSRLPPGSQASVRDVAEAYRTIPAMHTQWPGLVIRLQEDDQFAVNTCNNFGLTSAGGVYGMVADAGADIFRGCGIGPLSKWVDDHIFFRLPRQHLPAYNTKRAEWHGEIQAQGGRRQEGSRLWYGGSTLPSGAVQEFDEDCSAVLRDLASASPRTSEDNNFTYADADIDKVSARLGIRWETSKSVPFGVEVPYLGFRWNLATRVVHLLEEKKNKYLVAITEWEAKRTHNLLETQKLYGKLLHASLVVPAGRAYLTGLEAMLSSFNDNIFLPHTPPRDTPSDLDWWKQQLSRSEVSRPIPTPQPLVDYQAYSDASSGFGIAITVGPRWRAWRLSPGWNSQGRDIQWAEAVGFELLALCLCSLSGEGEHLRLHGDNHSVVEGWWKQHSANRPTNHIFRRILRLSEDRNRTFHTRYVPSAHNPADPPSRGRYPPFRLRLEAVVIPADLRPFLTEV